MLQIAGSPVVVTGGLRGIGRALVDELLQRGAANVYATARAPKPSGDPRVLITALDVTDTDSVAALSETATDVTIVINNAGTVGASSLVSSDLEETRAVFETNYFAALRIAPAFAPIQVRNGGGARVDIHSVLSWVPGSGAYGDSKAAHVGNQLTADRTRATESTRWGCIWPTPTPTRWKTSMRPRPIPKR